MHADKAKNYYQRLSAFIGGSKGFFTEAIGGQSRFFLESNWGMGLL